MAILPGWTYLAYWWGSIGEVLVPTGLPRLFFVCIQFSVRALNCYIMPKAIRQRRENYLDASLSGTDDLQSQEIPHNRNEHKKGGCFGTFGGRIIKINPK